MQSARTDLARAFRVAIRDVGARLDAGPATGQSPRYLRKTATSDVNVYATTRTVR